MKQLLIDSYKESLQVQEKFFSKNIDTVAELGRLLWVMLETGGRVLVCGNGGSAAQAQHLAAELTNHYEIPNRRALPVMALTTDTSALTSIANDRGFDYVFSRQVEALGQDGDVLLAISTSGRSANVIRAIQAAKNKGMASYALVGRDGGPVARLVDLALIVEHHSVARIQEVHQIVIHLLCQRIEAEMLK